MNADVQLILNYISLPRLVNSQKNLPLIHIIKYVQIVKLKLKFKLPTIMINIPQTQIDIDTNSEKIKWDLVINDVQYDVYRISGFYHTIGGHFGLNDYYCCPSSNSLTLNTIIQYDGNIGSMWDIKYKHNNSIRIKYDAARTRTSGEWIIYRNNKRFISEYCNDMKYGLSKAYATLIELQEHSIPFHYRDWMTEVINRPIYYYDQPALITEILANTDIIIVPENGKFIQPEYCNWLVSDDDNNKNKTSILDNHIYWYRDK